MKLFHYSTRYNPQVSPLQVLIAVSEIEKPKTKSFTGVGKCGGGSVTASQLWGRSDGFGGGKGKQSGAKTDRAKLSEGAGEGMWKGTDQIFHTVLLVARLRTGQSTEAPA